VLGFWLSILSYSGWRASPEKIRKKEKNRRADAQSAKNFSSHVRHRESSHPEFQTRRHSLEKATLLPGTDLQPLLLGKARAQYSTGHLFSNHFESL
jgi:hypothetical protein